MGRDAHPVFQHFTTTGYGAGSRAICRMCGVSASRQAATCSKHLFQTCTQAATADRAAVVAMLESRGQLQWLHPPELAAFQAVQLLRQQQHAQQQQQDLPPDLAAAEAPTGPVQATACLHCEVRHIYFTVGHFQAALLLAQQVTAYAHHCICLFLKSAMHIG